LVLPHGFGRVPECLLDVLGFEIGYTARISLGVMPSATIATTVATGMRSPRTQGMPSITAGSTVILVNVRFGVS